MLYVDVMLGQGKGGILRVRRRGERFVVLHALPMPGIPQEQAPVIVPRFHGQFDVIVMCFEAVPGRHESQYRRRRWCGGELVRRWAFSLALRVELTLFRVELKLDGRRLAIPAM